MMDVYTYARTWLNGQRADESIFHFLFFSLSFSQVGPEIIIIVIIVKRIEEIMPTNTSDLHSNLVETS